MKHWIDTCIDMSVNDFAAFVNGAVESKKTGTFVKNKVLKGKKIYLIFFNHSVRTRSSFICGILDCGGNPIVLDPYRDIYTPAMEGKEIAYSTERVADVARVLSEYGDAIAIRQYGEPAGWVYGQANEYINEFAKWSSVPVINMECDMYHPCQALADAITLKEKFGETKKRKIVVSWAYSASWEKPVAVPQSTILMASKLGFDVTVAHPEGLELDEAILSKARANLRESGGSISVSHDMKQAVREADVIYAKSWVSLKHLPSGKTELDSVAMRKVFDDNKHWICNDELMNIAGPDSSYMHCLPCDRGQEVTSEVVESARSLVFKQAANRYHAQNAIMAELLGKN